MKLLSLLAGFTGACQNTPTNSVSEASTTIFGQIVTSTTENIANAFRRAPNKFGMGEREAHPMQRAIGEELMADFTNGVLKCLREKKRTPLRAKQQEDMMASEWAAQWQSHCGSVVDPFCPAEIGECWAMAVLLCRSDCDAKFELRGNRKKFKRCIYKELKIYELQHPETVKAECTVKGSYY